MKTLSQLLSIILAVTTTLSLANPIPSPSPSSSLQPRALIRPITAQKRPPDPWAKSLSSSFNAHLETGIQKARLLQNAQSPPSSPRADPKLVAVRRYNTKATIAKLDNDRNFWKNPLTFDQTTLEFLAPDDDNNDDKTTIHPNDNGHGEEQHRLLDLDSIDSTGSDSSSSSKTGKENENEDWAPSLRPHILTPHDVALTPTVPLTLETLTGGLTLAQAVFHLELVQPGLQSNIRDVWIFATPKTGFLSRVLPPYEVWYEFTTWRAGQTDMEYQGVRKVYVGMYLETVVVDPVEDRAADAERERERERAAAAADEQNQNQQPTISLDATIHEGIARYAEQLIKGRPDQLVSVRMRPGPYQREDVSPADFTYLSLDFNTGFGISSDKKGAVPGEWEPRFGSGTTGSDRMRVFDWDVVGKRGVERAVRRLRTAMGGGKPAIVEDVWVMWLSKDEWIVDKGVVDGIYCCFTVPGENILFERDWWVGVFNNKVYEVNKWSGRTVREVPVAAEVGEGSDSNMSV